MHELNGASKGLDHKCMVAFGGDTEDTSTLKTKSVILCMH